MQHNSLAKETTGGLLRPAAAAEYLGTSESTLRRWRWLGIGPIFRKPPGTNRVYYKKSDLDAFIEQGLVDPRAKHGSWRVI